MDSDSLIITAMLGNHLAHVGVMIRRSWIEEGNRGFEGLQKSLQLGRKRRGGDAIAEGLEGEARTRTEQKVHTLLGHGLARRLLRHLAQLATTTQLQIQKPFRRFRRVVAL